MQETQVRSLDQKHPLEKGNGNPVFLPGKSHGQRSLVGHHPWGRKRVRHDLATKPPPPPPACAYIPPFILIGKVAYFSFVCSMPPTLKTEPHLALALGVSLMNSLLPLQIHPNKKDPLSAWAGASLLLYVPSHDRQDFGSVCCWSFKQCCCWTSPWCCWKCGEEAEGLSRAAFPLATKRKQQWLDSLAFIATNFICFLDAGNEFPKEMLLFFKTDVYRLWY